ncbi:hypothetical protein P3T27_007668 [Kitasatospora sp. MAA19]|uniref:hypothetical protein n=1 Tax=Kitasatospora sp. MAA19 TaxID=3035090 RepID=UPI0024739A5F|nr:hypothetical protein [Kitasatospora sp. MAA19]MDH6710917.1 hypothetical protein [Kitasatospora sp. MAA19]
MRCFTRPVIAFGQDDLGDDVQHTTRRSAGRMFSAATALLCTAGLLTACSSGSDSAAPPLTTANSAPATTSSAPSPTVDPTADAKAAVLVAYRGMWDVTVKAYNAGSLDGVDNLETYTRDKALAGIKVAVAYYQKNNLVVKGQPKLSPQIQALDLSSSPARATIRDCIDSSDFLPFNKTTGKPSETDGVHRHVYNSVAQRVDGHWLIGESAIDREQTC